MSAIRVSGLKKAFGGVLAVDDLSFDLAKGEILAMIGPNGAGKSTCFNILNGQLRADGGSVEILGRDVLGLPPRRIWRLGVGRTFQVTATFATMSVRENVQMALISHHRRLRALVPVAGDLYRDEADALLHQVGVLDQAQRPCAVLAYGDLKRVELAVALANDPQVLLMDEPTAGMAPGERAELMNLASHLVRRRGISVLFTEHDMDVVFGHAERVLVLNRGRLIAQGSPDQVRQDAGVREVYLGSGASYGEVR